MIKPNNYEEVQAMGEYTPINLGGHKLVIMKVEECETSNGNQYIKVSFDTAKDDIQPNYYSNQYKQDTRTEKKWSGVTTVFPTDNEGKTSRAFKTFCTSVEKSNAGFKMVWGEQFCNALKGKLIGGVFGEEEYEGNDGEIKTARKLRWFRSIEGVMDADVPAKKTLAKEDAPAFNSYTAPNFEEFSGDDDLPF